MDFRIYVLDTLPSITAMYDLCKGVSEDRNFVVVEQGVVKDCFKGTPDQCSNGIYLTFAKHEQTTKNPVRT